MGLGLAQYFANQGSNSRDYDFSYDWDSFRTRVSGSGYSLDTNKFDTNFLTHPGSGILYYWAARSNRLSPLASFAYALTASTLWEFLGEMRERVSINDLIVTPTAGFVLGETTLQLGAFFDRSCDDTKNRALGVLLGPAKSLHDAIDARRPLRDTQCDRYGFSQRGGHELRLSANEVAVLRTQGPDTPAVAETQLDLQTSVLVLEGYGRAGHDSSTFADGNVSELQLHGAFTGAQWTDITLGASTVPFGVHYRDLSPGAGGLWGHELVFGLLIRTEYSAHQYEHRPGAGADQWFAVDAPGMSLSYRRHAGCVRWEAELEVSPSFAGVEQFALDAYLQHASIDTLSSVARAHGYNYGGGVRVHPRARFSSEFAQVTLDFEAVRVWAINDFDRQPERESRIAGSEGRRKAVLWVSLGRRDWPLRLSVLGSFLQRWGELDTTLVSRTELRLGGGVDAVF